MNDQPADSPSLPPVVRAAWVHRPPSEAFAAFTDEIGAWWPLPTHGLFQDRAATVGFVGDKLVEFATNGEQAVWGEVLAWEPPDRFVIGWHPGRETADGSEVEVTFVAEHGGTKVVLEHRGWARFGEEGAARRRSYVGPNAWGYVLDHFADGAEPQVGAPDLSPLRARYDEFFAEFERGGFGPPQDGEWNAEQVVAHVTLNDLAMIQVGQALVHCAEPVFENEICHIPDNLDALDHGLWRPEGPGGARAQRGHPGHGRGGPTLGGSAHP